MPDDESRPQSEESDYRKVAMACADLLAAGKYPSVASVQAYMRDQLGGGIKTARISGLIRRWEAESKPARRSAKPAELALPSLDELLDQRPELLPVLEATARALAQVLAERSRQETEARVQAIQSALDVARKETDRQGTELHAEHAAELAEKDQVIEALRGQETAQLEEIDRLAALAEERRATLADKDRQIAALSSQGTSQAEEIDRLGTKAGDDAMTIERLGQDLALLRTELRQARERTIQLESTLAAATEAKAQISALVEGLRADHQAERSRNEGLHERIEALTRDLAAATVRTAKGTVPSAKGG